jgi:hypothetical protein
MRRVVVPPVVRACTLCRRTLPAAEFGAIRGSLALRPHCRDCRRDRGRLRRAAADAPDRYRAWARRYNATPRGKCVRRAGKLRRRLRRADLTFAGRAHWEAELALCATELARIDAGRDGRRLVSC